jgi:hypothetical protein
VVAVTTKETADASRAEPGGSRLPAVDFVRAGGASAVLAMVVLFAGIVTHIMYGGSPPDGMNVYLTDISANPAGNVLAPSLDIAAYLLLLVFMVALYQLLREGRGPMRLALVTGTFGLLLIVLSRVVSMAIVELAVNYAAADAATKPAIAAVADTAVRTKSILDLVGNLLAFGVGGALFSLAILRTSVLSRWLGWGGLVYAAMMWTTVLEVSVVDGLTARDSIVFFVAIWFGILWLVAMGVGMVRAGNQSVP